MLCFGKFSTVHALGVVIETQHDSHTIYIPTEMMVATAILCARKKLADKLLVALQTRRYHSNGQCEAHCGWWIVHEAVGGFYGREFSENNSEHFNYRRKKFNQ